MQQSSQVIATFLLSIAQFIIGILLITDKADIYTIGWYYVISSSFLVFVSIVVVLLIAVKNDKK